MIHLETEAALDADFDLNTVAQSVFDVVLKGENCPLSCEAELLITDPETVHEMNREYRKIEARDQKDPKVQEDLKKAEDRFFDIFVEAVRGKMKVIIDQLTWHDKLEPDSFFDVMGEVIDENLKSSLSRVGFFKSLSYRFKLN